MVSPKAEKVEQWNRRTVEQGIRGETTEDGRQRTDDGERTKRHKRHKKIYIKNYGRGKIAKKGKSKKVHKSTRHKSSSQGLVNGEFAVLNF